MDEKKVQADLATNADLIMAKVLAHRALGLEQESNLEQKVSRDIDKARAKRIVALENKAIETGLLSTEIDELKEKKSSVIDEFLAKNGYQQDTETGKWMRILNTNAMTDEELLQEYLVNRDDWGDASELLLLEIYSRAIKYEKELQEYK